jgi:hypothetical protein
MLDNALKAVRESYEREDELRERIRELESALAQINGVNDALSEGLAARDAVIERVVAARGEHPACNLYAIDGPGGCGWKRAVNSIDAAVTAAPELVLAEHDARVAADALMDSRHLALGTPAFDALTERAAEYRKGAGQ